MTMPERLNDTEREKADGEAVLRHAFHGEPLDPEVARRVRERGAEIAEEIYREQGEIDPETINPLFRGDDAAFGGRIRPHSVSFRLFFQNHAAIVTLNG